MPRGIAHPPELRARVVAEIAAGESITRVAQRWGVSKSRAVEWWQLARPVGTEYARAREDVARFVFGSLNEIASAVRLQLQVWTGEEWLAQQTAGDAAQLLAVELDRAIRLLAGLRPTDSDQTTAEYTELPEPESHRNGAVDSIT